MLGGSWAISFLFFSAVRDWHRGDAIEGLGAIIWVFSLFFILLLPFCWALLVGLVSHFRLAGVGRMFPFFFFGYAGLTR
jgi:hypothetical protein